MHDRDCLHRFLFEHYPIRGHIVHLDAAWRALLEHREYPANIRDVLGEAAAASVLLAATLKFDGTLSLQLRGQGPMHLMLAQCSSDLGVRAVARYRDAVDRDDVEGSRLRTLSGAGNLTITLENEDLSQRYQGIVPLESDVLAECLQGYFENSEQLPTRLLLIQDGDRAAGLLLQPLPGEDGDADGWTRVQALLETLTPQELLGLPAETLLYRLFHEDGVRLLSEQALAFGCTCSRERVGQMLQGLGEAEAHAALQGDVATITCEFCGQRYTFDRIDIASLFGEPAAPGSTTPQ